MIHKFHGEEEYRMGEEGMGKGNKKREDSRITRSPDERRKKKLFLRVLILVLLTFAFYSSVFKAGFIWDDDDYVTKNETLRSLEGLGRIWFKLGATPQYYPLAHTSFWLEYRVWGLNPFGYHLTNILLHSLNAVLLFFALKYLGVEPAWFAAGIFALHPVHVESVAWITERKNVLSGFFYLCSFLFYLHYANINAPPALERTEKRTMLYVLSLAFYIFALLSKTVAASLPAAILIILWWKKNRISLKDLKSLVPFFAAGIILGLTTIWMEKSNVGAHGREWDLGFIERCLIAGKAVWFYAGKILYPQNLSFIYPLWEIVATAGWQYLYPLGVIILLAILWKTRKRMGKGPLAAVLFFLVTLFPALGFFNIYPMLFSYVADHFQYLASIGIIVLASSAIYRIASLYHRKIAYVLFCCAHIYLGILTWRQGLVYRDAETLWLDTLAKNPASWMPHQNLGMILADKGRPEEALQHYRISIRLKPDDAMGHYNLGGALDDLGQVEEAMREYREALRLNPDFPDAYCNLGADQIHKGALDEAEKNLKKALKLQPRHYKALDNMGVIFSRKGQIEEAIGYYQKAIAIDPNYYQGYYNMAVAWVKKGEPERAVECYLKAVEINPKFVEAYYNLGLTLISLNQSEGAIKAFRKVLEINPNSIEAQQTLNRILKQSEQGNVRVP